MPTKKQAKVRKQKARKIVVSESTESYTTTHEEDTPVMGLNNDPEPTNSNYNNLFAKLSQHMEPLQTGYIDGSNLEWPSEKELLIHILLGQNQMENRQMELCERQQQLAENILPILDNMSRLVSKLYLDPKQMYNDPTTTTETSQPIVPPNNTPYEPVSMKQQQIPKLIPIQQQPTAFQTPSDIHTASSNQTTRKTKTSRQHQTQPMTTANMTQARPNPQTSTQLHTQTKPYPNINSYNNPPPHIRPPIHMNFPQLQTMLPAENAVRHQQTTVTEIVDRKEKVPNLVIEKMTESNTPEDDVELIKACMTAVGADVKDLKDVFRMGQKTAGRLRPVKVKTHGGGSKQKLLQREFQQQLQTTTQSPAAFTRNDLTLLQRRQQSLAIRVKQQVGTNTKQHLVLRGTPGKDLGCYAKHNGSLNYIGDPLSEEFWYNYNVNIADIDHPNNNYG